MMADQRSPWERILLGLRWPAVALAVVVVAALAIQRACSVASDAPARTVDAMRDLAADAAGIAERFRTGRITTTFIAAVPRLVGGDGTRLEVAAFEATEVFTRTDDRWAFFDLVSLGSTESEIRVPVTYRYHVRLDEPWRLEVDDHTCVVHAPRIRPTLPPAIHTDGMEKKSKSSWLRFDAADQMDELESQLTPRLSARAASPTSIDLVRETCRRRVAEFVRQWLLRENHWRSDRFRAITVIFADEAPEPADVAPPTLVLEPRD